MRSELIALCLARCEIEGTSPRTVRAYRETLGRFLRALQQDGAPLDLRRIGPEHVIAYLGRFTHLAARRGRAGHGRAWRTPASRPGRRRGRRAADSGWAWSGTANARPPPPGCRHRPARSRRSRRRCRATLATAPRSSTAFPQGRDPVPQRMIDAEIERSVALQIAVGTVQAQVPPGQRIVRGWRVRDLKRAASAEASWSDFLEGLRSGGGGGPWNAVRSIFRGRR